MPSNNKNERTPDGKKIKKPRVHEELNGFDIEIDSFGEIKTKFDINKINSFLDKYVKDKKFRGIDVKRVNEEGEAFEDTKEEDEIPLDLSSEEDFDENEDMLGNDDRE